MNIYKITQSENNGYDTYDAAIVIAPDESAARYIHPDGDLTWSKKGAWDYSYSWCCSPDEVTVELIGVAIDTAPAGVVLASFNAG